MFFWRRYGAFSEMSSDSDIQWRYDSPSAVTIAIVVPANIVGVRKVAMQDIGVDAHFRQRS